MSYPTMLSKLADSTGEALAEWWAEVDAGRMSQADFEARAVDRLVVAGHLARNVAELMVVNMLTRLRGTPVTTIDLEAVDEEGAARASLAATMGLDRWEDDPTGALLVLGAFHVHEYARAATAESMRAHHVGYWRRVTNPGACPVCTDMAADGALPASADMWSHRGCGCIQTPID